MNFGNNRLKSKRKLGQGGQQTTITSFVKKKEEINSEAIKFFVKPKAEKKEENFVDFVDLTDEPSSAKREENRENVSPNKESSIDSNR